MTTKAKSKAQTRAVLLDLDAAALNELLEQQGGMGQVLEVPDGLVLRVSKQLEGRPISFPVALPPSTTANAFEATITARKSTSVTAAEELALSFVSNDVVVAEAAPVLEGELATLTLALPTDQSGTFSIFGAGSYVLQRVVLTYTLAAPVRKAKGGSRRRK